MLILDRIFVRDKYPGDEKPARYECPGEDKPAMCVIGGEVK